MRTSFVTGSSCAALVMWLLVATGLLLHTCWSLGDIDHVPLKEKEEGREVFNGMPQIPELAPSIKDPAKWKNGTRMIFFYTPWCSYSGAARPVLYALIEQIYLHNISSMFIGQIDVSIHSDVARTFRIKATPTILMFRNGSRYEFIEELSLKNLLKFVLRIMSPPLVEVNTSSEVKELQKSHKVLFCLVHDHEIHEDWQAIYQQVAQERILIGQFLYTTNPDITNELGLKLSSLPGIVALKDDDLYQYQNAMSKYRLTLWVESEQFPALPTVNASSLRYFTSTGAVKRLVVLHVNEDQSRPIPQKKAYEAVRRVALSRKVHSGYQFLVLENKDIIEKIVSTTVSPPFLFVWEHHTGYYFTYNNEEKSFTEKGVSSFLYSVTAGKITAEGGPGFMNSLYNWYWWLYNLFQIMISHRPFLSLIAILLFIFGFSMCAYNYYTRPKFDHKRKEAIARARAKHRENLRRKKIEREKEKEQKKAEKEKEKAKDKEEERNEEEFREDEESYSDSVTEEESEVEEDIQDKKNK